MNTTRIHIINQCIEELPFVTLTSPFELEGIFLKGEVQISFDALDTPLLFEVELYAQYPFRFRNTETIKFLNKDLLECKHVMGNGTICIHTSHYVDLKEKLKIDLYSLKDWIVKYYINKENDAHYEHLIVPQQTSGNSKFSFMFTEVDYEFKKNEYGFVNMNFLNDGLIGGEKTINFLTHSFMDSRGNEVTACKWSSFYKNLNKKYHGIYIFVENSPAVHNRFIFTDWESFWDIFKKDFLEFLLRCEKDYKKKKRHGDLIPLYVGYKISETEIHWQVALLEVGNFPIQGVKENQKWATELTDGRINWGITKNASYEYFFGRGAFCKKITTKKILIIGTGAIGSIVARTLVKGGCIQIDLCDYDVKEPENVCRAEFQFANGIIDKIEELKIILSQISPFVEVGSVNQPYFDIVSKALFDEPKARQALEIFLNTYDIIYDCTTDNDLMYILNGLNLSCDLINMSITNKAKQLVCAFYPNMYDFVITQFKELLDYDSEDMHNPTGCWSPTFKASYNDINVLVQYALKHINQGYQHNLPKNNFVIETGTETECKLELNEF